MLASDLQGLGVSPWVAAHVANAGTGPLTITAAGSNFATATRIGITQLIMFCTNTNGTTAISLPKVGGDNGCLLGDIFIINNGNGSNSLTVYASTGVAISVAGTNTSSATIAANTGASYFPISTTQWIGVKG
jgi:hypothetical protein